MTEQKMRSALLFLAGSLLAAGAWGQTVTLVQSVDYRLNVASEFFGDPDGRTVVTLDSVASPNRTAAVQIAILGTGTGANPDKVGMLDVNNKAYLTFTLTGATFSGAINTNSLKLQRVVPGTPPTITEPGAIVKTITEGGSAGDREVTFELEVVTAIDTSVTGAERLLFEVPSLTVDPVTLKAAVAATDSTPAMPAVEGVRVDASIRPFASRSNPFPGQVVSADDDLPTGTKALAEAQIISLHSALGASLGPGEVATVAIDNLKAITDGTKVTLRGATETRGVRVGSLIVGLTDPDAAGVGFDPTLATQSSLLVLLGNAKTRSAAPNNTVSPSLAGNLRVRVSGDFQEGDRVVLGTDAAAKVFTPDGESVMVEMPLSTSIAAPGTPVVYIPGGVDDLTPRKFDASLELRLLDPQSKSGPAGRPTEGEIRYKDITTQGYAYGVMRADDVEATSFLRLTCASTTACSIFISCFNESGTPYFGNLTTTATVPSGGTGVYSSSDIAAALGDADSWNEGRGGRCDLLSNGKLEAQHMVRTSSNLLHNNSVVIGETQTPGVIGLLRASSTPGT